MLPVSAHGRRIAGSYPDLRNKPAAASCDRVASLRGVAVSDPMETFAAGSVSLLATSFGQGMDDPLSPLRTPEAARQLACLADWLKTYGRHLIEPELDVMQAGKELFRLTRALDEKQARVMLGRRPTFFATTDAEMGQYHHSADLGAKGRLVIIRGSVRTPLRVASADQLAITRIIYAGDRTEAGGRIGPFDALQPGPDGAEDSMQIRIQRWIVPMAVKRVLGTGFEGLRRTGIEELTVAKPLSLTLTFDWQEP